MRSSVLLLALAAACGGSAASQPDPSSPSSPAAGAAPAPVASSSPEVASAPAADAPVSPPPPPASVPLPTGCTDPNAEVCTPPGAFVERLCAKPHQEAALALFAKATPFTRMYLRGKMDELMFDEEVLALRYHPVPKNGIQVGSAAGSYDVLRWDGSCSMAVDADMLGKTRPPRPKVARLKWHRLGDRTQTALIAGSDAVKKAHARRGKECKGAMSGDVSASCEKADEALVDAVVDYVRGGGAVPPTEIF